MAGKTEKENLMQLGMDYNLVGLEPLMDDYMHICGYSYNDACVAAENCIEQYISERMYY